jgi:hypothetical protein
MDPNKPTKEELEEVERVMQSPEVAHASGMLLAAWRLYWMARGQLIADSKGKFNDGNFHIVSQALSRSAMSGFRVGKFKNQVKQIVLPWLKSLSVKEARITEKPQHGSESDPTPGLAEA